VIEFARFQRLKPLGLVKVVPDGDALFVEFARFSNETGARLEEPERCRVMFEELETLAAEHARDLVIIRELLALKT
jgi:folate-dependent tRNA-U54 methylase TrmFO/GidA